MKTEILHNPSHTSRLKGVVPFYYITSRFPDNYKRDAFCPVFRMVPFLLLFFMYTKE